MKHGHGCFRPSFRLVKEVGGDRSLLVSHLGFALVRNSFEVRSGSLPQLGLAQ